MLPSAAFAQQVPEGLAVTALPLPPAVSQSLVTPSGLVTYDGSNVILTPPGQAPSTLLSTSGLLFGSFLLQIDANNVLFGHTGLGPTGATDRVWLMPLQGPPPAQPLAAIPFNYDVALFAPNAVLISARTGGFASPNNELLVLDTLTGGTQTLAVLPGASGPVAVATNGDVFYATAGLAFPQPPGTVNVLRFPRPVVDQALLTQTPLGLAAAQTVLAGLDAAGDMLFDDDGDLLFVDWMNGRVTEINDAQGSSPSLGGTIADFAAAPISASSLQWLPGTGGGVFEPFQRGNGRLLVHASDFFSSTQLLTVSPSPAVLSATGGAVIPTGSFDLNVAGGPAAGIGVMALAFGSLPGATTVSILPFEQPLWLSDAILVAPTLLTVPFDASGAAVQTIPNPGFNPAFVITVQSVFVSASGVLGASNPVVLTIGQ
jgi:hypothetical protein